MRKMSTIKGRVLFAIALGLAVLPVTALASLRVGDAAPDFALPDSTGATHRLSDFRGQVVALLAWENF